MANPFLELKDREAWGPGSFEMAQPLVEAAAIKPGMRVLEVGGGSGQIAVTLAKHWNVTVFTLEPWFGGNRIQARAAAEGVFDRVIALKLKAQDLVFADATFDAVISVGSFEMIGDERVAALGQMVRVARPGARIGVAEPMCKPGPIPADLAALDREGALTFEHHFRTIDWNAALFRDAGLEIVAQRYFDDARRWWLEYVEARLTGDNERIRIERELIQKDADRWLALGMVVGEKPRASKSG